MSTASTTPKHPHFSANVSNQHTTYSGSSLDKHNVPSLASHENLTKQFDDEMKLPYFEKGCCSRGCQERDGQSEGMIASRGPLTTYLVVPDTPEPDGPRIHFYVAQSHAQCRKCFVGKRCITSCKTDSQTSLFFQDIETPTNHTSNVRYIWICDICRPRFVLAPIDYPKTAQSAPHTNELVSYALASKCKEIPARMPRAFDDKRSRKLSSDKPCDVDTNESIRKRDDVCNFYIRWLVHQEKLSDGQSVFRLRESEKYAAIQEASVVLEARPKAAPQASHTTNIIDISHASRRGSAATKAKRKRPTQEDPEGKSQPAQKTEAQAARKKRTPTSIAKVSQLQASASLSRTGVQSVRAGEDLVVPSPNRITIGDKPAAHAVDGKRTERTSRYDLRELPRSKRSA